MPGQPSRKLLKYREMLMWGGFVFIVVLLFCYCCYFVFKSNVRNDYVNSFQPRRKMFSSNPGICIALFWFVCLFGFILQICMHIL